MPAQIHTLPTLEEQFLTESHDLPAFNTLCPCHPSTLGNDVPPAMQWSMRFLSAPHKVALAGGGAVRPPAAQADSGRLPCARLGARPRGRARCAGAVTRQVPRPLALVAQLCTDVDRHQCKGPMPRSSAAMHRLRACFEQHALSHKYPCLQKQVLHIQIGGTLHVKPKCTSGMASARRRLSARTHTAGG